MAELRYLSVEDLVRIHDVAVDTFGGEPTVTQAAVGAMESVLHSASYQDGELSYAAAILFYIATAQHFTDGNKRTAWFGCVRALELNGFTLAVSDDEAKEYVISLVLESDASVNDVADALAQWVVEIPG